MAVPHNLLSQCSLWRDKREFQQFIPLLVLFFLNSSEENRNINMYDNEDENQSRYEITTRSLHAGKIRHQTK